MFGWSELEPSCDPGLNVDRTRLTGTKTVFSVDTFVHCSYYFISMRIVTFNKHIVWIKEMKTKYIKWEHMNRNEKQPIKTRITKRTAEIKEHFHEKHPEKRLKEDRAFPSSGDWLPKCGPAGLPLRMPVGGATHANRSAFCGRTSYGLTGGRYMCDVKGDSWHSASSCVCCLHKLVWSTSTCVRLFGSRWRISHSTGVSV